MLDLKALRADSDDARTALARRGDVAPAGECRADGAGVGADQPEVEHPRRSLGLARE